MNKEVLISIKGLQYTVSEETGEEFTIDLLEVGESETSTANFTIEKNQEDFDLLIEATGTSDGTPVKA